jgi:YggT family protein
VSSGASTLIPLADTRDTIADYVGAVFLVYLVLIIVRVLLTWIPRMPYNPTLRAVVGFIEDVTDPYLNVFRRFLPPVGGGAFALDLSPIIGIILLIILRQVVVGLIAG